MSSRFLRLPLLAAGALALFCTFTLGFADRARAQTTTFAQFFEDQGENAFKYTNNGGTSATFNTSNATVPSAGVAVDFKFQNIASLPSDLSGFQSAHLVLSATTTSAATQSGTSPNITDSQSFNQSCTLTITRDTAAAEGGGSRTVLLQVTFTLATFSGTDAGNSATLSGSGSGSNTGVTNVKFTSDFLSFDATTQRALALSFSSLNPSLSVGTGNFLNNFAAAGSGTFSSNPVPVFVPEAATLLPVGLFLCALTVAERWRRRRQQQPRALAAVVTTLA